MNIIKQGDKSKLKKIKKSECKECGCIFEAEKGEYQIGSQYNEIYYYCKCPCCCSIVYEGDI